MIILSTHTLSDYHEIHLHIIPYDITFLIPIHIRSCTHNNVSEQIIIMNILQYIYLFIFIYFYLLLCTCFTGSFFHIYFFGGSKNLWATSGRDCGKNGKQLIGIYQKINVFFLFLPRTCTSPTHPGHVQYLEYLIAFPSL